MSTELNGVQDPSRRSVLRHGAKLAYVTPVVLAAMKAEPAFAASDGEKKDKKPKK